MSAAPSCPKPVPIQDLQIPFVQNSSQEEVANAALPSNADESLAVNCLAGDGEEREAGPLMGRKPLCVLVKASRSTFRLVDDAPMLNWLTSSNRLSASLAKLWAAAVVSSTIAAFCCVPWSMVLTAALISLRPVACSLEPSTIAATLVLTC